MHIHVLYIIGKGKALPSRLYDFCTIIECQNENTLFENYMVIYTGRKMDVREEQRAYCKIRRLLGKSTSEIRSELDTVYGENTLPYRIVARWVSYFKEGRSSVRWGPSGKTSFGHIWKWCCHFPIYYSSRFTIYGGRDKWFIGLEFVICLYYPERKIKAIEDLCSLDTPSADPWTKEGSCGKGLFFAI